MNNLYVNIGIVAIIFAIILLTGYWLGRRGRPYGSFPFSLHKLIGLGAGVFLGWLVIQHSRQAGLQGDEILILVVTVLLFVFNVAAGGLLGAEDGGSLQSMSISVRRALQLTHKVFPYLIILSTLWLLIDILS